MLQRGSDTLIWQIKTHLTYVSLKTVAQRQHPRNEDTLESTVRISLFSWWNKESSRMVCVSVWTNVKWSRVCWTKGIKREESDPDLSDRLAVNFPHSAHPNVVIGYMWVGEKYFQETKIFYILSYKTDWGIYWQIEGERRVQSVHHPIVNTCTTSVQELHVCVQPQKYHFSPRNEPFGKKMLWKKFLKSSRLPRRLPSQLEVWVRRQNMKMKLEVL